MFKKVVPIFIVIIIVAFALIAADKPPKKEPVYFFCKDSELDINPDQTAVVRVGWYDCSQGLVQDAVDHFFPQAELYQDGNLLQTISTADGYWDNPIIFEEPDPDCWHVNEPQLRWWYYELKIKKPGTYTVKNKVVQTAQLVGGGDWDQDGIIDIYPAGEKLQCEVTLNVLETVPTNP